ncbi:hypothetical protein J21TS3_29640 [Paenibacillus cookii]|uniref:Uncharacterized protein n=1 Tax=Paenibacillus cookii TaxID=157839 RepID=A0ABQ4LYC7_9BACL|nr:hypothetical protein J21TS3_29640 [Paenibacillus cookii]
MENRLTFLRPNPACIRWKNRAEFEFPAAKFRVFPKPKKAPSPVCPTKEEAS